MHKDIVYEYPEGVEMVGTSPLCEVQGMYIKGRIISVQGHPEFNEPIMEELLEARHNNGMLDDKTYSNAMSRVADHHDGVVVAGAFLRFLLED